MIEEYLGKRPPDDAQGVLQDVHWSWGQYANFPGYSLGNVIAGMLWSTLTKKQLLPIRGDKSTPALKGWLAENVHKPGATYPPKGTAQPSLRPWIRPVGSCKLSRKQVP